MKKLVLIIMLCGVFHLHMFCQLNQLLADTLNKTLQEKYASIQFKGISSAVVFPDGSSWVGSVGKYASADLHDDLLYEIGSNTKSMVAAIILLLEEEGKLSIEDTLYKFISPLKNVSYGITLKQLLNHTSGLYNYTAHPDFYSFVNNNWSTLMNVDSVLDTYVDPPNWYPGQKWEYCNTNYLLLGKVIESIENKDFHIVLREKLFNGIGLDDCHLAFYDSFSKHYLGTWLYNGQYKAQPSTSFMSAIWAAGGVVSTPKDLAKWAYSLYGGSVLSQNSFDKMTETIPHALDNGYGLGMIESIHKGKKYLGHRGTTLQNSYMQYGVDRNFSIVTMSIEQGTNQLAIHVQYALIDVIEFELSRLSLGISKDENRRSEFAVFPIPSNDHIIIQAMSTIDSFNAYVYNSSGKVVYEETEIIDKLILDKARLGVGLFYIKIITDDAQIITKRLIFN